MATLFEPAPAFEGLPADGFSVFSIEDREARRRSIIDAFHPALRRLGEDLLARFEPAHPPLHAHLPRLDWPRNYQPFSTWLALSREAHGYQSGPQLNVGVHADHVAIRLGWDTASDLFGRFEFLCRRGDLGGRLVRVASEQALHFRVYAAAAWPAGSHCIFASDGGLAESFAEAQRRGVWWEIGRRYDLPEHMPLVSSAELGLTTARIFDALLPLYDRIVGEPPDPAAPA